jgi:hypothetical protein
MRVMAQEFINMRNADIKVEEARQYHRDLLALAAHGVPAK